jgi:hypothetical protein
MYINPYTHIEIMNRPVALLVVVIGGNEAKVMNAVTQSAAVFGTSN